MTGKGKEFLEQSKFKAEGMTIRASLREWGTID